MKQKLIDFDAKPELVYSVSQMFEHADERLLRKLQEDRRFERKTTAYTGEKLGRYFSMWANTSPEGGLIAWGVHKNGAFEGCRHISEEVLSKVENTGHVFCADAKYESRRVTVTDADGQENFVLIFRVQYNPHVVAKNSKGQAFIRRGDECHHMTPEEVRELAIDKGQVPFEEEVCTLKYPSEFDTDAVRTWAAAVRDQMGSGHELSDTEILCNRHLGRFESGDFVPYNACALLFAKDPRALFPGCKVRFLRYEGEEEGTGENYNTVKDIWIEGTIPTLISKSAEVISNQLRDFSPLTQSAKFETKSEYPKLAWYEALVNACVHRSYGNGLRNTNVFVRMFDDHLDIESPGPFPPFVTAENIYEMHRPRNPRIMEALFFLRLVQMNREGTRRMRDTMEAGSLPAPEFAQKEVGHALVRVTLRNNIHLRRVWVDRDVRELLTEAVAISLSDEELRIVNWTAENGEIRINDCVRVFGISWQRSRRLLIGLAKRGIFQYIRFKEYTFDQRDPKAYFRLRSDNPLPKGAFEVREFK